MIIRQPHLIYFLLFFLFLSASGCVSIPKAAPDLSLEMGKQIRTLEANHKLFVQKFFDEKRQRVDEFIQEDWLPLFAKNFFEDSLIWNTYLYITTLPDGEKQKELLNFVLNTGPKLQVRLDQKRMEMMKPLDDLQQEIENQISAQYDEILSLNNSLTNFLSSASKVEQNRDRYLQALGINQNKLNGFIDSTDVALNNLVGKANAVGDFANTVTGSGGLDTKINSFINTIKNLKNDVSGNTSPPLAAPGNN